MSAVMKSTRRARSIMWITKTIRITNGTEHDIDIQVKAVHQNQCGLIRQAHIQEEIISRRATFIPGITRDFRLPRKSNRAKVTLFLRNEIVREETLCYGTEWTIDESSLNSYPRDPILRPIESVLSTFSGGLEGNTFNRHQNFIFIILHFSTPL